MVDDVSPAVDELLTVYAHNFIPVYHLPVASQEKPNFSTIALNVLMFTWSRF